METPLTRWFGRYVRIGIENSAIRGRYSRSLVYTRLQSSANNRPTDRIPTNPLFYLNTVIADYGPFNNQRLYYLVQAAGAIPFPTAASGVPAEYVGLTTQQLWNLDGIAVGGAIAPAGAVIVPSISGLVGPPGG